MVLAATALLTDHTAMTTVVPFKARGMRAELRAALEQRTPMRFHRCGMQPGWVHGFVVGMSREHCLIAEVGDTIRFDGFLAIAIADLTAIEPDPAQHFVLRALEMRSEQLQVPESFPLDDWASIARAAADLAPLISLNMVDGDDGESGEVSYVGQLVGVEPDALVLREIDPNADWYPDTGIYEIEALGSISFGSGYLDALWQVAGAPRVSSPTRSPASDTLH